MPPKWCEGILKTSRIPLADVPEDSKSPEPRNFWIFCEKSDDFKHRQHCCELLRFYARWSWSLRTFRIHPVYGLVSMAKRSGSISTEQFSLSTRDGEIAIGYQRYQYLSMRLTPLFCVEGLNKQVKSNQSSVVVTEPNQIIWLQSSG